MSDGLRYNLNKDGSFMNREQIIDDLIAHRLPSEIREFLRHDFKPPVAIAEQDLIRKTNFNPYAYARVELGRWIRNSYGLWDEKNPYTDGHDVKNGTHPDDFSDDIISELVTHYKQ